MSTCNYCINLKTDLTLPVNRNTALAAAVHIAMVSDGCTVMLWLITEYNLT